MLVTHGLQWLPRADVIVVLSGGRVSEMGTYLQLMSHDGPFAQFLTAHLTRPDRQDDEDDDEDEEGELAALCPACMCAGGGGEGGGARGRW